MEIVIFTGLQGAGKSTFHQKHFVDTHVRINLDMLKSRHRERVLIASCFAIRQKFVVDNTNPTRADRQLYILMAKMFQYKVIGYYFDTPLEECIERNKNRPVPIPIIGLHATYNKLQTPTSDEGYDQLFRVSHGEVSVLEYADVAKGDDHAL
jgi:predicted kinase